MSAERTGPSEGAPPSAGAYGWLDSRVPVEQRVDGVMDELTLDEKLGLLGLEGSPVFDYQNQTPSVPRLGIPRLVLQDGPAGVAFGFTGITQFPAPIAVAASWDPELAERAGRAMGAEAWGRGIHVLQTPTVNIARVPQHGRTFEAYGEDPCLTSRTAVAMITGVQQAGPMACVKHIAANNQEHQRNGIDERISERALREIYLPAFEAAVSEGQVGSVMTAFNKINGVFSTENPWLLTDLLKEEWGFSGFVRSDFGSVHSTEAAYNAGLDQSKRSRPDLKDLVSTGKIGVDRVDDAVRRVLRQLFRFAVLERGQAVRMQVTSTDHARVARDVAERGTVLLRNVDAVLPLLPTGATTVAVLGNNAGPEPFSAGGGSALPEAPYVVPVVDAMTRRAAEADARVRTVSGAPNGVGALPVIESRYLTPVSGTPGEDHGLTARYYVATDDVSERRAALAEAANAAGKSPYASGDWGEPIHEQVDPTVDFTWARRRGREVGCITPGVPAKGFAADWRGTLTPPVTDTYTFSLTSDRGSRLFLDGELVIDNWKATRDCGHFLPFARWASIDLDGGRAYQITVEYYQDSGHGELHLGWSRRQAFLDEAARVARDAEVAVVVANDVATEGADKPDLSLPYGQDELITAVAAVNPNTVVVLTTGSAVTMPWLDQVRGVVQSWYPGQEFGGAIAAVLFGDVNPSGKLPITFGARAGDYPASTPEQYPGVDGVAQYSEGIFVGYRHFDREEIEPLFPFGFGLSYTTFEVSDVTVTGTSGAEPRYEVTARVRNVGERAGAEVVQLYVGLPDHVDAPPRQLRGFRRVELEPGEQTVATLHLSERDLSYWDASTQTWTLPPGRHRVMVGTSCRHIAASEIVDVID